MIAAARRRISSLPERLHRRSRGLDRIGNRGLERAYPTVRAARRHGARLGRQAWSWIWLWLRPLLGIFFRALAALERSARWLGALLARAATAGSAAITPGRAAAAVVIAAGACLVASQFIDYRAVEIGQPGYAGLQDLSGVAAVPTVEARTAGAAHAYLLVPVGLAAMVLGMLALRREAKRLGLLVIALGLLSLAVILLVDLPSGLDAGAQNARFAGASAVLRDGFYAELAAAAGLVVAGLLYYARPCRIRINSSGRAASARRRRPRRRASSRARVARSALQPRRSAASAPVSPR